MIYPIRKFALSLALGVGALTVPTLFAIDDEKPGVVKKDEKKDESKKSDEKKSEPPSKLPDFSKTYASEGEVAGVVAAADADSITIRITYAVPTGKKSKPKEENQDITFKYAEGGMARTKVTPMRADAKGKFVKVPANELEVLKKPSGAPGWHVDRGDVKAGAIVVLELVRPKSIAASKVTMEDKLIKYAIINGETTPPKITKTELAEIKGKAKEKEKKDKP